MNITIFIDDQEKKILLKRDKKREETMKQAKYWYLTSAVLYPWFACWLREYADPGYKFLAEFQGIVITITLFIICLYRFNVVTREKKEEQ